MLYPSSSIINILLNSLVCIIVGYFNSSSLVLAMSVITNYMQHKERNLYLVINYRKISKISPFMYKPPKHPPFNRFPEYKPPGGWQLEIALKYQLIIK